MTRYLLSIQQPDGDPPGPEIMEPIVENLRVLLDDMRAAGAWVFSGGLHAPHTATVIRVRDGELLMTDGPYAEGKEHVGGFWIIEAPDLDAALVWGGKAAHAVGLPIEVRPFQEDDDQPD